MIISCSHCHALHWKDESLSHSTIANPKFGMCCLQGKISLPPLHPAPRELLGLLTSQDPLGRSFRLHIRNYNSALAMTSVGRTVNHSINQGGGGPYTFVLQGQLSHQAGSLLPPEGEPPRYAQLYIYDTDVALDHRMQHPANAQLDRPTLATLQDMLYRVHSGVQLYKQAYELTRTMPPEQQCRIALRFQQNTDRRRYQNPDPSVREIAVILPGDGDTPAGAQDIILYRRNGPLFRITDSHPSYPSLRYVLLFPTGQNQWHPYIPFNEQHNLPAPALPAPANEQDDLPAPANDDDDLPAPANDDDDLPVPANEEDGQPAPANRETFLSLAKYFCYRLHVHPTQIDSHHLFLAGKLFQEYVCEAWAVAEQKRLGQLKHIQGQLRSDIYQGLADAVAANDTDLNMLGKRFILPSSFSGGTRHLQQQCQDALAINRYFGGGDLFVTITANPSWPEITDALFQGQTASDRPDLVVRVFHAKLKSLIKDFRKGILGDMAGYLYTIEFQKRGLPHAHIIVFLKPHAKLHTPNQIDSLMSSEFPVGNPDLLELIKKFMVHGPCGQYNSNSPCMQGGTCTKGFPKPFREHTTVTDDSYARTRRSNTGQTVQVGRHLLDNRWVICHSQYLIWKYRCHINVESVASVKAIKYIYKYIYKGHDRTTMEFGTCLDEIKLYLDARYISSCEASWRLYFFDMHNHEPTVVRLNIHLPLHQSVVFDPVRDVNPQQVLTRVENKDTTLTAWFKANAGDQHGVIRDTLYQDFPSKMRWNRDTQIWTVRKRGFAIGRMYYAHPSSGERFYLRLLLTSVKGATSFEDLCFFQGTQHTSFREACIVRGLLEDDNEWDQCLQEASHMQTGHQLRHLFVTILKDCLPADPRALWDTFWHHICDDLRHQLRVHVFQNRDMDPSEAQIQDYGLYLIDQLLSHSGKRLADWPDMPQVVDNWDAHIADQNPLIAEQREYGLEEQAGLAAQSIASLNPDQQSAFDRITSAITNSTGETFFLHGPGGTGKTYLYNTLCYSLRSQNKIVLCVASSGIAALLLKGGRTAHSRFKIPVPCNEATFCTIPKTSHLARLISQTDLVIWDEAPMQHRHIMETVDRSFRDLRDSDKPFGGLTIVFGKDFQQILPVVLKGDRAQVVGACMQRSILWRGITVLQLHQNMRLNTHIEAEANFARWQLEVGHGQHTDDLGNITLPDHFRCRENTVASLIDTIYPNIQTPNPADQYFSERIILSSKNEDVNALNKTILERFPGDTKVFASADSIPPSEHTGENDTMLNYPVEHLNAINASPLP